MKKCSKWHQSAEWKPLTGLGLSSMTVELLDEFKEGSDATWLIFSSEDSVRKTEPRNYLGGH